MKMGLHKTVSRNKPPKAPTGNIRGAKSAYYSTQDSYGRPHSGKPRRGSGFSVSPPPAGAFGRANQYEKAGKGDSYYKETVKPVADRDPNRLAAEQSKGGILPRSSYKPGVIIRALVHEQDFNGATGQSQVTKAHLHTTASMFGAIHTKCRKMIIVGLYADHYTAVPVYTHNGRGLAGKKKPLEFVSVRDHRYKGDDFKQLSGNRPIVTESLKEDVQPFSLISAAHVAYPLSRKYDLPVTYERQLRKDGVINLLNLVNEYSPKASNL